MNPKKIHETQTRKLYSRKKTYAKQANLWLLTFRKKIIKITSPTHPVQTCFSVIVRERGISVRSRYYSSLWATVCSRQLPHKTHNLPPGPTFKSFASSCVWVGDHTVDCCSLISTLHARRVGCWRRIWRCAYKC